MKVHYLEIVTPDPDGLCAQYTASTTAIFGEPIAELGGARIASLSESGMIGIRGPLRETEVPVVRPYFLVSDIEGALSKASAYGGEIAMPATEIPNYGRFAILIQDGIESGLWEID